MCSTILYTGISNLLQPAQAEVVLGHLSTHEASWVPPAAPSPLTQPYTLQCILYSSQTISECRLFPPPVHICTLYKRSVNFTIQSIVKYCSFQQSGGTEGRGGRGSQVCEYVKCWVPPWLKTFPVYRQQTYLAGTCGVLSVILRTIYSNICMLTVYTCS
jgi:hypothetical protein